MAKATIDKGKVRELHDKGVRVIDIATQLGVSKGAISKTLKKMRLEITKAVIPEVTEYVKTKNDATRELRLLVDKAFEEIDWIENTVPPKNGAEYRAWQDQKLKYSGEIRRLFTAVADIGYKLFQADEVREALRIIDEEIQHESIECQQRIRERLTRRRSIRFPLQFD